jgi:hypothetical protein
LGQAVAAIPGVGDGAGEGRGVGEGGPEAGAGAPIERVVAEALGVELDNTVHALDSSTIDLCLSLFHWAPFRSTKAAIKLHTLLDLRGAIPTFIHTSDGKLHDLNVVDMISFEAGAFSVMDRGYIDFSLLFNI